jgi:hypothetical protein
LTATGSDKIADPDLASFAAAADARTRSVIVELDVPDGYAPVRAAAKKLVKPKRAATAGMDKYAIAAGKSMAKFEKLLDTLGLLPQAVKLPSAASYVLDVNPEELRALSESPLVAAIRPNRMHRVGVRG